MVPRDRRDPRDARDPRDPGEPRDVDPGTVDRRGVKRECVKDAFSTNISRIEGRVKEDPEANIVAKSGKVKQLNPSSTISVYSVSHLRDLRRHLDLLHVPWHHPSATGQSETDIACAATAAST